MSTHASKIAATSMQPQLAKSRMPAVDLCAPDEVIANRYIVVKKVKAGGYGQVYEAKDRLAEGSLVALKIEDRSVSRLLGRELEVLRFMQKSVHTAKLIGCGKVGDRFNYIAMQLLGPNLSELRRQCPLPRRRFSPSTACRLGVQCLTGLKELHLLGYVHRDIKPSNYAIGRTKETGQIVFLIDFGMARLHIDPKTDAPFPARHRVTFRGTLKYASVASHSKQELGRKDDLWSLLYSVVEMFTGRLPWSQFIDKPTVAQLKSATTNEKLCEKAPLELYCMAKYLSSCKYADKPDYDQLERLFRGMSCRLNIQSQEPYDWEVNFEALKTSLDSDLETRSDD